MRDIHENLHAPYSICEPGQCLKHVGRGGVAFDDVALGVDRELGEDGIWTFRRFSQQGLLEFLCRVAPNLGTTPTCAFADGDAANGSTVVVTGGRMRALERRYYDVNGRLHVRAVYDPETTVAGTAAAPFRFPNPADTVVTWFAAGTIASCPAFVPSRTFAAVHRYDVTVYTANSDGDATLNELGTTDLATKPDALVVRVNRRAQTTLDVSTKSECSIFERNARGDITKIRRFFDDVERDEVRLQYLTLADAHARGRLEFVQLLPTLGTTTGAVKPFLACATSPYDDEGRLKCYDEPHATGNVNVATTFSAGDGNYAFKRLTTTTNGTSTFTRFEKVLGSGVVHEDGIGNPLTTGVCGGFGRATLRVYKADGDAAQDGTVASVQRLDSACAAQEGRSYSVNAFGQRTLTEVRDRFGVLRSKVARTPDVDDRTISTVAGDAALLATTLYSYEPWDALLSTTEPDGDVVEYVHGIALDQTSRLEEVRRGAAPGSTTAVLKRLYTRDGLIKEIQSPGEGYLPMTQLSYDAMRRLSKETRNGAGQTVELTYRDGERLSRRIVKGTDALPKEDVTTTYDAIGRRLQEKNGTTILRAWVYDTKGAFAGASLGSIKLIDDFQAGRLAYEEDPAGATFYNYDFVGRVTSVIRHDVKLAAFDPINFTAINFTYASTASGDAGQLTTMTYPSGLVVTYGYTSDKERPDSVSAAGLGTLISQATFEPSGEAKELYFGATASFNRRQISRDILGRVTRIEDRYANGLPAWSDVTYAYALPDGDVTQETDVSLSHTWLRRLSSLGNQSRSYGYLASKDILKTWSDDGTTEDLTTSAEARRVTEIDGAQTFTYTPGTPTGVFNRIERVEKKEITTAVSSREVDPTFDSAGRWSNADWPIGGAVELTFAYGQLGNTTDITVSSVGAYALTYDAQTRPATIVEPTGAQRRFLYAFGRAPVQERFISAGVTTTAETIFLEGAPVVQVTVSGATTNVYNLHTDRMGMVRKVAQTNGTRVRRIVADAWGASNSATGDVVIDLAVATAPPFTNWRYPGQFAFSNDLRLNGWRIFAPEIGQYTSPEPLHASTAAAHYGPQAYSYATARPLMYTDPTGRNPVAPLVACAMNPACVAGVAEGVGASAYVLSNMFPADETAGPGGSGGAGEAEGGLDDGSGEAEGAAPAPGAAVFPADEKCSGCPPCPPPPPSRIDRVPPSRPHAPCIGDHMHTFVMNQLPNCECRVGKGPVVCLE